LFVLPIAMKALCSETLVCTRLPMIVSPRGAAEINIVVPATLGEERRIKETCINNVEAGQQVLVFEPGMDRRRH